MIGVVDSKICNIFSLTNMLDHIGAAYKIMTKAEDFADIDKIILPGVGSFPKAMENLKNFGMIEPIHNAAAKGTPILGICLGMQLLFEQSEEFGICNGLGLIPGRVVKIQNAKILPHMGWDNLNIINDKTLLQNVVQNADVYFVHSYRAETEPKYILATSEYGDIIPAVVGSGNIYGTQFHPEKSQKWGEIILKNFVNL
ncbi:MAG: imidazole glycerol phosphate synthase subunit HisH [Spirochaetales bacterium]|nr:imidazole glycerol phosphate synthase subunit HisH [Spirochaetales bacterium]